MPALWKASYRFCVFFSSAAGSVNASSVAKFVAGTSSRSHGEAERAADRFESACCGGTGLSNPHHCSRTFFSWVSLKLAAGVSPQTDRSSLSVW